MESKITNVYLLHFEAKVSIQLLTDVGKPHAVFRIICDCFENDAYIKLNAKSFLYTILIFMWESDDDKATLL